MRRRRSIARGVAAAEERRLSCARGVLGEYGGQQCRNRALLGLGQPGDGIELLLKP